MNRPIVRIATLVFPETSASVIFGLHDFFLAAGRDWGTITDGEPGPALMESLLVARDESPLKVVNGVMVLPHVCMKECLPVDIVCVPEVNLPPGEELGERFREELTWIREQYERGTLLAASCSGAMLFAEAGLLDGYSATTHWAWCDVLRKRYPKVDVHERRALVVSGEGQRLVMAGGGSSWMDLALYLIARTVNIETAMQVARLNLIDWHETGQQPFARLARTRQVEDAVIARCQIWIAENYQHDKPVTSMLQLSGLPERTFKRRFRLATGMSPLAYVQTLRLEEAKQMLESGDSSIEAIANEVGYEDAGFFSRLFQREVSLTPSQYRKRFGHLRKSLLSLEPHRPESFIQL